MQTGSQEPVFFLPVGRRQNQIVIRNGSTANLTGCYGNRSISRWVNYFVEICFLHYPPFILHNE